MRFCTFDALCVGMMPTPEKVPAEEPSYHCLPATTGGASLATCLGDATAICAAFAGAAVSTDDAAGSVGTLMHCTRAVTLGHASAPGPSYQRLLGSPAIRFAVGLCGARKLRVAFRAPAEVDGALGMTTPPT